MTATTTTLRADVHLIGWVSIAHGLSHFFQLVLPPLFPLIKDEFGLSYTLLGAVLSVFYAVSGLTQTAAGFAVDRFGPRIVLIFGLLAASIGAAITAVAPGVVWLFVAAIIAGAGNSVFHPADLALINARVSESRLGYAFSVHNVAGNIGWVCAPLFAVGIAQVYGWRLALAAAAIMGVVFTVGFAANGAQASKRGGPDSPASATRTPSPADGVAVLMTRPVVMAFVFFALQAVAMVGFMTFSPAAFAALYDLPIVAAASMLTAFLVGGLAGTLAGGALAARTVKHDLATAGCLLVGAALAVVIAAGMLPAIALWPIAAGVGFAIGMSNPSRDILVRRIAPPHARGRVYGFVYSGLDAGAGVAPLIFGWLLDRGWPAATFALAALALVLAIPTVMDIRPGGRS